MFWKKKNNNKHPKYISATCWKCHTKVSIIRRFVGYDSYWGQGQDIYTGTCTMCNHHNKYYMHDHNGETGLYNKGWLD